jgi:RNA polymerase sigma factor (TIGR02999 family)
MEVASGEITLLARRWGQGDELALDRLVEVAYDDLRTIAHRLLRSGAGADRTLGTTALVHELYLKLAGVDESTWGGRAQFFGFCAKAMRRILIDHARRQQAEKRGGARSRVPLDEETAAVAAEAAELIAVDAALERLARRSPRMARIVECRYFAGLSVPETAETVGASPRTVEREWARACAYLSHELGLATALGSTPGRG